MKSKNRVIFLVALLIILGCRSTAQFRDNMKSWEGQKMDDFIAKNGYPANAINLPNGNIVYVYELGQGAVTTGVVQGGVYVSSTQTYYCRVYMETEKGSNIIKQVTWEGNNCKADPENAEYNMKGCIENTSCGCIVPSGKY